MNLLGKIFTVFIAFAALGVMIVSMLVYATHKNWREEAQNLNKQLSDARTKNEQLESDYRKLDSQLKAEVAASQQDVSKLESERVALLAENTSIQKQLDQLRQQERANTAAVAATQTNNETLASEVGVLRQDILKNQQGRDQAFTTALHATDQLHQAQGDLSSLRERNLQLAQDLGTKTTLLRENGVDPNTDPQALVPRVRGIISATHRTAGTQLIEVSIGADDGLKPGHTLEVFRGDRYLGRAEILKTEPDRAVGRILRRFQQGQIQEGDHVATKLRVG